VSYGVGASGEAVIIPNIKNVPDDHEGILTGIEEDEEIHDLGE